ncbi:MAG: hypothetical protein Q9225_004470 [Loekoesia sp. 1 TL-2023]
MSSDNAAAVSAFVEGAPPGEVFATLPTLYRKYLPFVQLADVIADVKKLTVNEPKLLDSITPAFQKYNEEQLTTVKLPGSSKNVLISQYNSLGDGRYYDTESQRSFSFDHQSQVLLPILDASASSLTKNTTTRKHQTSNPTPQTPNTPT